MKGIKLLMFLMLLNSIPKKTYSCSYQPLGEDIRFSLFSSDLGKGVDMEALFYSANYFNTFMSKSLSGSEENISEWNVIFENKFDQNTIDELIYDIPFDFHGKQLFENKLYQHFQSGKESDIGAYILFAKKVEYLLKEDFWTKKVMDVANSEKAFNIAVEYSKKTKNETLKLRYAYQAIVLAYYLNWYPEGIAVFDELIKPLKTESVIYYWALFHKANMIDDLIERGRLHAIVFDKSRSKNKYIFNHFSQDSAFVEKVLGKCENEIEKSNVLSVLAFKKPSKAINDIVKIAELNPGTTLLDILLVREINKIEDWYFTDLYTGQGTAIESYIWSENKNDFTFIHQKNFNSDKTYLIEVYEKVEKLVFEKRIPNQSLWYTSLAYMSYMLDDETLVERNLKLALENAPNQSEMAQIANIELLSNVKFAKEWDITFQEKLYDQINALKKYSNELYNPERTIGQVMLAVSRKYLKEGNIVLAALFEGKVKGNFFEEHRFWGDESYQVFDLLNTNASSTEMDDFFTLWNKENKTPLETYLFENLTPLKWRFTDLWATTYLREDKLETALTIYELIPDSVWNSDNADLHYYYKQELDANPFETRFTRSSDNDDHSKTYTKPEFVKELIRLKEKVATNTENQAYYYMLLGNAYYNMTVDGNSWYYSEYALRFADEDYGASGQNDDYFEANRALKYYQLAEKKSRNKAFSAFCYRLQYKCLAMNYSENYNLKKLKKYRSRFKNKYTEHYEALRGCDQFQYYFSQWKKS